MRLLSCDWLRDSPSLPSQGLSRSSNSGLRPLGGVTGRLCLVTKPLKNIFTTIVQRSLVLKTSFMNEIKSTYKSHKNTYQYRQLYQIDKNCKKREKSIVVLHITHISTLSQILQQ